MPATLAGGAGTANSQLTILAMNAMDIPTTPGTYVYTLNAYDAGTGANDEKRWPRLEPCGLELKLPAQRRCQASFGL